MRGRGTADRGQHVAQTPEGRQDRAGGRHRAEPTPRAVSGTAVARRTVLLATAGVVVLAVVAVGLVGFGGKSSATVEQGVAGVVVAGHTGSRSVSDPGSDGDGSDGSDGSGSGVRFRWLRW